MVIALCSPRAAAEAVEVRDDLTSLSIGRQTYYLEDKTGELTLKQVASPRTLARFKQSTVEAPSFGYTQSRYWFYVDLDSRLAARRELILEVPYPPLDRIEVFVPATDGTHHKVSAGESFVHGNKTLGFLSYLFPLQVHPGKQRIFIRVQTNSSMLVPLKIWTPAHLQHHASQVLLVYGVFVGLFVLVFLYNLFLYITIRDTNYLYYLGYLLGTLTYTTTLEGLPQEYIWGGWPWWVNVSMPLGLSASWVFGTVFAKKFLKLAENAPRLNRVLTVALVMAIANTIGSLFLPYKIVTVFVVVVASLTAIQIMITAMVVWRRGYLPARLYLAAWVAWLSGVVLICTARLGLLPVNIVTDKAHMFGFVLNATLLSLALADRINLLKREQEQAQAELLELERRTAEALEAEVEAKTLDLQRKNQDLEEAYERLTEHDRLKSNFFANVSHELRTPLTLLLTPLERLLTGHDGKLPDSVLQRLRSMQGNTQRLLRLVNQLLDFSRLESGGMQVSFERMDVRGLVEPVVEAFEAFAQSKQIKLELRAKEQLPELHVDPDKLDKVLCNLLSNACKFTDSGGKIVVKMTSDEQSLRITVQDTGIGIGPEDLSRIFERFHQVDGGAARRYEGTGIGLALSKELVELMGGGLEVESRLGFGSTFTVVLPMGTDHIQEAAMIQDGAVEENNESTSAARRARAAVEALAAEKGVEAPEVATSPNEPDEQESSTRPLLVVVEDNPDMRALVAEICQQDYRVLQAVDGQQGLDLVKKHLPSAVVADVMMPRMDGNEMLRRMRADPPTAPIPVLLLTAKAGSEKRLEGLESGADDYLVKPFESRELLARVGNLTRIQQQKHALQQINSELQQQVQRLSAEIEQARRLGRFLPPGLARSLMRQREAEPRMLGQSGKRQRLTVFALHLRGFDTMIQELDAEEVAALVSAYLTEVTEVACQHGASLDRFVRDEVIGFFGAVSSRGASPDAVRCATMALDLWQHLEQICARWQATMDTNPPQPTMVLTSGHAMVGIFGARERLEFTAMGAVMDQAEELLRTIAPGQLVCTQPTWRLLEGKIAGLPCGEVPLRGRRAQLKLHRLAGAGRPLKPVWQFRPKDAPHTQTAGSSGEHDPGDLKEGLVLDKRYRLMRRIGGPDPGTTFLVQDLKLDEAIVVKALGFEEREGGRVREDLYRQVHLARLISHPHVARIFDITSWAGLELVFMEHLEGQTLQQRLDTRGPLPLDLGLQVLVDLCAGLGAIHAAGMVHRALKPSNILLRSDSGTSILELGVSGWTLDLDDSERLEFLAPEQQDDGTADARSDIYALGAIASRMFASADRPHEPRTDLPPMLSAVIQRCLAEPVDQRFSSVREISTLLHGSIAGDHPGAEPEAR